MLLLLDRLHKSTDFIPLHLYEFMDLCACDESNVECAHNECISCKDGILFDKNVADRITDMDKEVQWYEWKEDSGGYLSKCLQSRTIECAVDTRANLPHFIWHQFIQEAPLPRRAQCVRCA